MGFLFLRVHPCQHDRRAYIMVDKKRKREGVRDKTYT